MADPESSNEELISIHAPAKGATICGTMLCSDVNISIHAPAKGATLAALEEHMDALTISIHAPAKGATRSTRRPGMHRRHFNPRSREGSDAFVAMYGWEKFAISIHAPAKGATQKCLGCRSM